MSTRRLAVGLVVCAATSAWAQPKDAKDGDKGKQPPAPSVDCELFEVALSSSKTPPAADAALKPIERKLNKPQFAAYNTHVLLSHTNKTLTKLKAESFPVKVGKTSIMFDSLPSKSQVRLQIQVDDSKGKRALNTTINIEGGDFFMSVTEQDPTAHLLALTCKPTK